MQTYMQRGLATRCLRAPPAIPRHARRGLLVQAQSSQRMIGRGFTLTSPAGWELMKEALRAAGVKLVSPQEVIFAQQKGVPVIDVRPEADYERGHVPGAINVAIYRPITGWDPYKVARRLGYALFGVLQGTELNPAFAEEVAAAVPDLSKGVILYCSQGGSLEAVETSKRGRQSRSLVAAYDLVNREVANNVVVMKGGYYDWTQGGRDIEVLELVEQ